MAGLIALIQFSQANGLADENIQADVDFAECQFNGLDATCKKKGDNPFYIALNGLLFLMYGLIGPISLIFAFKGKDVSKIKKMIKKCKCCRQKRKVDHEYDQEIQNQEKSNTSNGTNTTDDYSTYVNQAQSSSTDLD